MKGIFGLIKIKYVVQNVTFILKCIEITAFFIRADLIKLFVVFTLP